MAVDVGHVLVCVGRKYGSRIRIIVIRHSINRRRRRRRCRRTISDSRSFRVHTSGCVRWDAFGVAVCMSITIDAISIVVVAVVVVVVVLVMLVVLVVAIVVAFVVIAIAPS